MAVIKLPIFSGMVPSVDKHLLAEQNAAYCNNVWLYSGALMGIPERVKVHDLVNPDAQVAFRISTGGANESYLFDSFWVEFEDEDTDFIKAPTAGDTYERYYWASPSEVPKYNTAARLLNGDPSWLLGLPQPTAPTIVVSGGAANNTTLISRAYITTLVTEYGEEGPASTPLLVNSAKSDATFTLTLGAVLASDMGVNRNVKKIRLYRTIVASDGSVDYFLVTEVNALTTTQVFVDTVTDAVLASQIVLESTAWTAPPNLDGIIAMPNGITAGFKGKELWFSEAYRPHAWPASYTLYLEHEIVGLGMIGQSLVVCTNGNPYVAAGVNPASVTTSKLASFEPCLTKGSIVSAEEGVYYASANGLMVVNPGLANNLTKEFISKDKWTEILNSGRINGGKLGSAYYAFGAQVQALFQENMVQQDAFQQTIQLGTSQGFMLDPTNSNVGFTYIAADDSILSVQNDALSGEMVMIMDGGIWWHNQNPGHLVETYKWQSKIFQAPKKMNFVAFKCYLYGNPGANFTFTTPRNNDINQEFNPDEQLLIVRVYADGRLILTHEIRESGELHKLPTGFKADFWQIEFEGRATVKNLQMATSVKELAVA